MTNDLLNDDLDLTPRNLPKIYFDLLEIDIWEGVFAPTPVRFEPEIHKSLRTQTFIEYITTPANGSGNSFSRVVTLTSDEWKTIHESLSKLWGTSGKETGKKFVDTFHKRNGGAYIKRESKKVGSYKNKAGVEKDLTAPYILAIYKDVDECLDASEEVYGKPKTDDIPGFEDELQSSETHADYSTIAAFLANFIVMAMQNGKVNETTFKGFFDANELFVKQFATVENSVVRRAIEKANGGTIDPNELGAFIVEEMKLPF